MSPAPTFESEQAKDLCLGLLRADTAQAVITILKTAMG